MDEIAKQFDDDRQPQVPAGDGDRHRQDAAVRRADPPLPRDAQRRAGAVHRRPHRAGEADDGRLQRRPRASTSRSSSRRPAATGELLGSSRRGRDDPVAHGRPPLPRGVHAVLLRPRHQRRGAPLDLRRCARGRAVLPGDAHRPDRHAEGVPEEHQRRAAWQPRTRRRWKRASSATPITTSAASPGMPTFRYDIIDAVQGPRRAVPLPAEDLRHSLRHHDAGARRERAGRSSINEQEENFKIQDLERKIFTPAPQPRHVRGVPQGGADETQRADSASPSSSRSTRPTRRTSRRSSTSCSRASPSRSPRASRMRRPSPRSSATASARSGSPSRWTCSPPATTAATCSTSG